MAIIHIIVTTTTERAEAWYAPRFLLWLEAVADRLSEGSDFSLQ
jgi:hypothetical protein